MYIAKIKLLEENTAQYLSQKNSAVWGFWYFQRPPPHNPSRSPTEGFFNNASSRPKVQTLGTKVFYKPLRAASQS